MKRTPSFILLVLLLSSVFAFSQSQDDCEQPKYGSCFSFHGRYRVHTGDGLTTLWPAKTHRILRVMDFTDDASDTIAKVIRDGQNRFDLWGDFSVCPLEKERRGWMREVCLKEAKNLMRVQRYKAQSN